MSAPSRVCPLIVSKLCVVSCTGVALSDRIQTSRIQTSCITLTRYQTLTYLGSVEAEAFSVGSVCLSLDLRYVVTSSQCRWIWIRSVKDFTGSQKPGKSASHRWGGRHSHPFPIRTHGLTFLLFTFSQSCGTSQWRANVFGKNKEEDKLSNNQSCPVQRRGTND